MKQKIKKRMKWLGVTLGGLLVTLLILALIYNQNPYEMLFDLGYKDAYRNKIMDDDISKIEHLDAEKIFGLGYNAVYRGNNERGNNMMNYALSKMEHIDAELYHSLSVQNTKNGNYDLAIAALEKAMQLDPKEVAAYYGWVLLYYYRDYERALAVLDQYDAYTPNFDDVAMAENVNYLKGICYMQLRQYEKAIAEFDTYAQNTTKEYGSLEYINVYSFIHKGRCLAKLGKYGEAILSYKQALELYEKCPEAYYFMGLTQLEMGKTAEACMNFTTALSWVKKGYSSGDTYVEFFHEIYTEQIKKSISESCSAL